MKDSTTTDYYAKNIGLIKTLTSSGGIEISSTLKSVEENAVLAQQVRFYYPDPADGRIYYLEKEADFKTNDSTAKILEEKYRDAVQEVSGVVFPTDAAIKSLTLDEKNRVRLDLNDVFSSDSDLSGLYERVALQCIADTFGGYYGSGEVIITVEGKPYQSKQIKMETDEPITVKLEGITEKKPKS